MHVVQFGGTFSELKKLHFNGKKSVNSGAFKIPKLLFCVAQRCVHYTVKRQSINLMSVVLVQNANFI